MICKKILVEGHVQGVGFRAKVKALAENLDLKGTVRNLSDGRLEIIIQGPSSLIDSFVATIRDRPGAGKVSAIFQEDVPAIVHHERFEIIY